MFKLPLLTWIGNAAAVLLGSHGDISAQARGAGCSRQAAYDHAAKVQLALRDTHLPGPGRAELLRRVECLRQDNLRLRRQLAGRIELDEPRRSAWPPRPAPWASASTRSGNSFGICSTASPTTRPASRPPRAPPSAAGCWPPACSPARRCAPSTSTRAPLARVLCPDEIFFHGKPVLVAVEPHSMAVLLCQKAADRKGQTWRDALRPFAGLEHVVADAGTGLQAGLRAMQRDRPAERPLAASLDVFHLEKEARQALGWLWRKVEARWEKAAKADARAEVAKPRQRGGRLAAARAAWRELEGYWAWYERWEAAWGRLKVALQLFRPDGGLNGRDGAQAEVRAACKLLPGPKWRKVRKMASDRRMLAFLDLMKDQLGEAEPRPQVREALVELWRLQQQGGKPAAVQSVAQQQVCECLASDWRESYRRVGAVLGGIVARLQFGGVHQQRVANAAGPPPERQPGHAGPQEAVLELPGGQGGQARREVPVPAFGGRVANV